LLLAEIFWKCQPSAESVLKLSGGLAASKLETVQFSETSVFNPDLMLLIAQGDFGVLVLRESIKTYKVQYRFAYC
jgi:hypothetical protein